MGGIKNRGSKERVEIYQTEEEMPVVETRRSGRERGRGGGGSTCGKWEVVSSRMSDSKNNPSSIIIISRGKVT